ncbi:MAG: hypothetical protein V1921_02655 [Candidatus Altiarchaeota archaeon]
MTVQKNLKPILLLFLLSKLSEKGERKVDNLRSMKLLFLIQKEGEKQVEKGFNFVPYKYGPYSEDYFDTSIYLSEKGLIDVETDVSGDIKAVKIKPEGSEKVATLQTAYSDIASSVSKIVSEYANLSTDLLLLYIYSKYADFTIRSEIKDKILSIAKANFSILQSKAKQFNFSEGELNLVGI